MILLVRLREHIDTKKKTALLSMMEMYLTCQDRAEWRRWLADHRQDEEVWLIVYKKCRRQGSMSLDEAVEEALCFGWIDGKVKGLDTDRYTLRFTPRRAGSVWSMNNIRRVGLLIDQELMTEFGLEKVAEARQNGQWQAAIDRERTDVIPRDLERALRRRKGALSGYRGLKDARKKQLLYWLSSAKRADTRQNRIAAIVSEAAD